VCVCVFMWFSEQTVIMSLYSINLTDLYNSDGMCLLRGTNPVCNSGYFIIKNQPHAQIVLIYISLFYYSDMFRCSHHN
jgi:hypothetical protein